MPSIYPVTICAGTGREWRSCSPRIVQRRRYKEPKWPDMGQRKLRIKIVPVKFGKRLCAGRVTTSMTWYKASLNSWSRQLKVRTQRQDQTKKLEQIRRWSPPSKED